MKTKKELGIPFVLGDNGAIRDDKGNLIVVVNDKRYDDFIILVANNYHALVEALEKLACLGNGEWYGNSEGNAIAQRALGYDPAIVYGRLTGTQQALLATHTQEEASGDTYGKDSQPRPINTNEATE